jgi:hypothetical protein
MAHEQQLPQLGDGGPVHGLRFTCGDQGAVQASPSALDPCDGVVYPNPLMPDGVEVAGQVVALANGLRLFQHRSGAFFAWCDLHRCPTAPGPIHEALHADCAACAVTERLVRDTDDANVLAARADHEAGLARLLFAVLLGNRG